MKILEKIFSFIIIGFIVWIISSVSLLFLYQDIGAGYNGRDGDTGGIFLMLWILFASILVGYFSVTEKIWFINNKNEILSKILYILIGLGINIIGLFVAWGVAELISRIL